MANKKLKLNNKDIARLVMRAMILKQPKPIEESPLFYEDVEEPFPGKGEIRIKIKSCGVCHTDLHTIEGDLSLPKLPIIPGHQIVGIVDNLGSDTHRFKAGERVGVPWLYSTCQDCQFCIRGLENLCEKAYFTGLHKDGGYAQYIVVPEDFSYPLPDRFPDLQAAPLLCAGIIGYRSLRLSEIKPGEKLGMYGFGASAHVTIQVARYLGCEVYVFTRSAEHRKHAEERGAFWTGSADDKPPVLMDSSIIFAPSGDLVLKALKILRKGGTLALAGIHMSPIPKMDYHLIYGERTIRSVANSTRGDAEELLKLAAGIPLHTDIEVFPLNEANEVLKRLKRSEIKGAAVLEIPEG
ncbi:MAG TPA: zinc-dependent alcohol dehydrogenase family protein [Nitrospinota bacterium]|nr:zinc-dependent alcohol dehydrogenase family protein [Nitrospinota bacterium]